MTNYTDKIIERARQTAEYFSKLYDIPPTSIVWCGAEKYVVCKNGKEIKIGFGGDNN